MIIKGIVKFSFPALLLAASASAFAADEEVKLDGGKGDLVSWEAFVDALNNPVVVTDAKGEISALPPSNTSLIAYNSAKSKVDADKADLATKQAAVDETATPKPTLIQNLDDANQQLTEAQDALENSTYASDVEAAKTAYENKEADLANWNTQLATNQAQANQLAPKVTSLSAQLDDAKEALTKAQKAYEAVGTTVEHRTDSITPWLYKIYDKAQKFLGIYDHYMTIPADEEDLYAPSGTVYCNFIKGKTNELDLAFGDKPTDTPTSGTWESLNEKQFYEKFVGDGRSTFSLLYIYLGDDYKGNTQKPGYLKVSYKSTDYDYIISEAVDALKALTQTTGYYTTTTTSETTYNDPDGKLEKAVEDAQAEVNRLTEERKSTKADLTTANQNITTYQGYIDAYTKPTTEGGISEQTQLKNAWDAAVKAQDESTEAEAVTTAEAAVASATKALNDAKDAVTAAQNKLNTDQEALDLAETAAQAAADELANAAATAAANAKYADVQLAADVVVTTPITAQFNGHINGDNHAITVNSDYLFANFNGELSEVAINGKIYQRVGNSVNYTNVARWNNSLSSNKGVFYSDGAASAQNFSDLGELGFAVRDYFGVNFAANGLASLTDESKVYAITVKELNKADQKTYVQINGDNMVSAAGALTIPANTFAESATDDIASMGLTNVYYSKGNANVCEKVVIEDRVNFYSPVQIAAEKVELNRKFTQGYNSVCLPFAFEPTMVDNVTAICKYDRETPEKFFFTAVAGTIPANTPMLVITSAEGASSIDLSDITIEPTDATQIVMDEGAVDDPSATYGTFKKANLGEFAGESASYKVYGLTKDGSFKYAGANSSDFPAFRMVIRSENVASANAAAKAPRRIAILDEKGIEITDQLSGISNVTTDAKGLEVVGGQGEINFTSEADYGKVEVYSINGSVVAVANVIAGTTSVNVPAGIYIVMGQKVVVK